MKVTYDFINNLSGLLTSNVMWDMVLQDRLNGMENVAEIAHYEVVNAAILRSMKKGMHKEFSGKSKSEIIEKVKLDLSKEEQDVLYRNLPEPARNGIIKKITLEKQELEDAILQNRYPINFDCFDKNNLQVLLANIHVLEIAKDIPSFNQGVISALENTLKHYFDVLNCGQITKASKTNIAIDHNVAILIEKMLSGTDNYTKFDDDDHRGGRCEKTEYDIMTELASTEKGRDFLRDMAATVFLSTLLPENDQGFGTNAREVANIATLSYYLFGTPEMAQQYFAEADYNTIRTFTDKSFDILYNIELHKIAAIPEQELSILQAANNYNHNAVKTIFPLYYIIKKYLQENDIAEMLQSIENGQHKDLYDKLYNIVQNIRYVNYDKNPKLAELCKKYAISEGRFDYALSLHHKKYDMLPDVSFVINGKKGEVLTFSKMAPGDIDGLFLGCYTKCCQSIHADASHVAIDGYTKNLCGFYVVRNDQGKIVGQSFAWLAHAQGKEAIVFDSFESLPEVKSYFTDIIQNFYNNIKIYENYEVFVGAGGETPELHSAQKKFNEYHIVAQDEDLRMYGDAASVYHITSETFNLQKALEKEPTPYQSFDEYKKHHNTTNNTAFVKQAAQLDNLFGAWYWGGCYSDIPTNIIEMLKEISQESGDGHKEETYVNSVVELARAIGLPDGNGEFIIHTLQSITEKSKLQELLEWTTSEVYIRLFILEEINENVKTLFDNTGFKELLSSDDYRYAVRNSSIKELAFLSNENIKTSTMKWLNDAIEFCKASSLTQLYILHNDERTHPLVVLKNLGNLNDAIIELLGIEKALELTVHCEIAPTSVLSSLHDITDSEMVIIRDIINTNANIKLARSMIECTFTPAQIMQIYQKYFSQEEIIELFTHNHLCYTMTSEADIKFMYEDFNTYEDRNLEAFCDKYVAIMTSRMVRSGNFGTKAFIYKMEKYNAYMNQPIMSYVQNNIDRIIKSEDDYKIVAKATSLSYLYNMQDKRDMFLDEQDMLFEISLHIARNSDRQHYVITDSPGDIDRTDFFYSLIQSASSLEEVKAKALYYYNMPTVFLDALIRKTIDKDKVDYILNNYKDLADSIDYPPNADVVIHALQSITEKSKIPEVFEWINSEVYIKLFILEEINEDVKTLFKSTGFKELLALDEYRNQVNYCDMKGLEFLSNENIKVSTLKWINDAIEFFKASQFLQYRIAEVLREVRVRPLDVLKNLNTLNDAVIELLGIKQALALTIYCKIAPTSILSSQRDISDSDMAIISDIISQNFNDVQAMRGTIELRFAAPTIIEIYQKYFTKEEIVQLFIHNPLCYTMTSEADIKFMYEDFNTHTSKDIAQFCDGYVMNMQSILMQDYEHESNTCSKLLLYKMSKYSFNTGIHNFTALLSYIQNNIDRIIQSEDDYKIVARATRIPYLSYIKHMRSDEEAIDVNTFEIALYVARNSKHCHLIKKDDVECSVDFFNSLIKSASSLEEAKTKVLYYYDMPAVFLDALVHKTIDEDKVDYILNNYKDLAESIDRVCNVQMLTGEYLTQDERYAQILQQMQERLQNTPIRDLEATLKELEGIEKGIFVYEYIYGRSFQFSDSPKDVPVHDTNIERTNIVLQNAIEHESIDDEEINSNNETYCINDSGNLHVTTIELRDDAHVWDLL